METLKRYNVNETSRPIVKVLKVEDGVPIVIKLDGREYELKEVAE